MVRCSFVFGLIGSALLCAQIALGDEMPSNWNFTPAVGFTLFEGGGLKNRPVFSLGAGLELADRWEVEGAFSYLNTKTKGDVDSSLDISQVVLSVRYDLTEPNKLVPYLLAGGGGFYANSDKFGNTSGVSLHVGAGLRYMLNDAVALKGEVRQQTFFGMLDEKGDRETCSDLTTMVGLEFRFPAASAAIASLVSVTEPPVTETEPECSMPCVRISPRFNPGEDKIRGWGAGDLEKMNELVRNRPLAIVLVMSDVDEQYLALSEFKLQKSRALYLRFFLIGHFHLDPNSVQIVSHQNLARFSKKELDQQVLIRFTPVENPPAF